MTQHALSPRSIWLLALLPGVCLLPQHYLPWLAAHQDGAALALLVVAGLQCRSDWALPRGWALAARHARDAPRQEVISLMRETG